MRINKQHVGFLNIPGMWYTKHSDFIEGFDWWCFAERNDNWYDVVTYCTYEIE